MSLTEWTGFIGVTLLVAAYFLNLINVIHKDSWAYLLANTLGAALACTASVLLHYIPFILLEATWTAASLYALIKFIRHSITAHQRG